MTLDVEVGDEVAMVGEPFTVVGLTENTTVLAGLPFTYLDAVRTLRS